MKLLRQFCVNYAMKIVADMRSNTSSLAPGINNNARMFIAKELNRYHWDFITARVNHCEL